MWTTYLRSREARELCSIYVKFTVVALFTLNFVIVETKAKGTSNAYRWRGEQCSKHNDCDQSRFLKCVGGLCDCQQESGLIWMPREDMCMIMEGMPCADEMGLKCVHNSSCISGVCECDIDFLRNGDGLCYLSYGNLCNFNDRTCAKRYLLQCPQHADPNRPTRCECQGEGTEYVWDENKRKCVSTAGGFCDILNNPGYGKDDQLECIKNAECTSSGRCECTAGFTQTSNGDCVLKYGEKCNNSAGYACNTNEFLLCQDGICACEFYGQMAYDGNVKQCRWLVGEDCEIPKTTTLNNSNHEAISTRRCVEDAYCEPRSTSHNRGTCVCKSGLVKSTDNTCTKLRRHGHACSASMDCDTKQFLECALALNDNQDSHCECFQNNMYFDGKQCRVYPGKNCKENKHCAPNSYCEGDWCVCNQEYQIDGLECVSRQRKSHKDQNPEVHKKTTMLQVEENGFTSSADSQITRNNCSNQAFLSLDWNMCMCQIHSKSHMWSSVLQKCLGLVCTKCITSNDCVANAVCDVDTLTCQCSVAAQPTRNRTCELVTKSLKDHLMQQHDCTEKMHALKSIAALDKPDLYFHSNKGSKMLGLRGYTFITITHALVITLHYYSVFTKLLFRF